MIPKIIHYCWFGYNKKPRLVNNCIESWAKFFPDYKIVEWNESNFDIDCCDYTKEAYAEKKWAYVSDYVRMWVLFKYGGIYFDTDVEVLKPFGDEILKLNSFSGIEAVSGLVSPGLVYACNPGDAIVNEILQSYKNEHFLNMPAELIKTINKRTTEILDKYGYIHENVKQEIGTLVIFPNEYFCCYDLQKHITVITEKSLSVHHYSASWLPWHVRLRHKIGVRLRKIYYSCYEQRR